MQSGSADALNQSSHKKVMKKYRQGFGKFGIVAVGALLAVCIALPGLATPARIIGAEPGSRVNVREAPSTNAPSPHFGLVGDRVTILDQITGRDGYTWYYVEFPSSGAQGWIRGDFIQVLNSSVRPPRPSGAAWSHVYQCEAYQITLREYAPKAFSYSSTSARGSLNLRNGTRRNTGYSWIYSFKNGDTVYEIEDSWPQNGYPGSASLSVRRNGTLVLDEACEK